VSTFVYDSRPAFFDDPFFRREVAADVIAELEDTARQARIRNDRYAQMYRQALTVAQWNLKTLRAAGVRIAFGTDTGPPGRFQGYFEHLELELMAQAGLTPMQIIVAATSDAARCARIPHVGSLERGRWADFIVLTANPLDAITNLRRIESVWIAGHQVPAR
jgi:imidazolonepropionase-like amidohydrolase